MTSYIVTKKQNSQNPYLLPKNLKKPLNVVYCCLRQESRSKMNSLQDRVHDFRMICKITSDQRTENEILSEAIKSMYILTLKKIKIFVFVKAVSQIIISFNYLRFNVIALLFRIDNSLNIGLIVFVCELRSDNFSSFVKFR